ncbi:MAG: peptide-binding protein [Desulfovibrionaceae bacterium]|nr:peptide-binding protein [Desulfovibrionaceae bacterium]
MPQLKSLLIGVVFLVGLFLGSFQDLDSFFKEGKWQLGFFKSAFAQTSLKATALPRRDLGDRILFGSIGEASNLIPYLSVDSASHEVAGLLYIAPLRYNKDLEPELWAAESFSLEDEGKRLRFKLREGMLWEDGQEVTAHDVEFTYKLVIDPATASPYAEDFLRIKEFKLLDRYSFEVSYEKFYAGAVTTWMNAILPKHILEGQDIRHTSFARKPLGAGPFRLKTWKTGSSITLEASETYFLGRPNLDEVVFRIIPDQATMFMETRAGRLDVTNLSPLQYLRETDGPKWQKEFAKYRYLASMYVFMGFNLEHPYFKDVRVRQAISKAISRQEIVQGCLLGQGIPAFGPYIPGSWAYHKSLKPVEQDLDQARSLLAEAGFQDEDQDGILDKAGRPFSFTILTNQGNEQRILVALLIQEQLAKIGIKVQIRTVEWAAFIREFVNKGHFDAVILGWTVAQDPDIYNVWHSSQAHDGGLNFVHYRSAKCDQLLEEARSIPDQKKRQALYYEFQEELYRDTPYCFLFVPYALPLVQRRFHGISPALAGIMYNFEQWWVPKGEQRYQLRP